MNFPHGLDSSTHKTLKIELQAYKDYGLRMAVLNPDQRRACHDIILETGGVVVMEFGNPVHNGRFLTLYVWAQKFGTAEEIREGKAAWNEKIRKDFYTSVPGQAIPYGTPEYEKVRGKEHLPQDQFLAMFYPESELAEPVKRKRTAKPATAKRSAE
jgi:hypothetical protein